MIKNPLAETFNFGSAEIDDTYVDPSNIVEYEDDETSSDLVTVPEAALPQPKYEDDEEDKEITKKIDDIYDSAMEAYQNQTAYVEILEPRYAARNAEVAANYLNTALNAVSLKAKVKGEKRKTAGGFIPYANNTTTNNVVVADRNQLLRMIMEDGKSNKIIDSGK
jgi:hypothetical protein